MQDSETIPRELFALPNEILLNVFALISTKSLVNLAPTCRHVHSLVTRIIAHRLLIASGLDGNTLYLECDLPEAKFTTSKIFCSILGTNGLQELAGSIKQDGGRIGHSSEMHRLYTRFRPVNKELDFRSVPRPHPAGDYRSPEDIAAAWKAHTGTAVIRSVDVEALSQLETVAFLCRRKGTKGLLHSYQPVCDGTIRLWRKWLSEQCERTEGPIVTVVHSEQESHGRKSKSKADSATSVLEPQKDPSVLWLNTPGENVGIKFRVKEKELRRDQPVMFQDGVELPVSYHVELEEILVRTTHLLLMQENLCSQMLNEAGKVMIFASYLE